VPRPDRQEGPRCKPSANAVRGSLLPSVCDRVRLETGLYGRAESPSLARLVVTTTPNQA
jgi:hypothetical protein